MAQSWGLAVEIGDLGVVTFGEASFGDEASWLLSLSVLLKQTETKINSSITFESNSLEKSKTILEPKN